LFCADELVLLRIALVTDSSLCRENREPREGRSANQQD